MLSKVHNRFGTAGLVVSIVALIAALAGTAFAAQQALSGKQKKEVEKIAKQVGKPGPTGPTGPQGLAGPKGDTGSAGAAGGKGTDGAAGKSPEGTNFTGIKTVGSTTCTEGGIEFNGATTNLACNGKKGKDGKDGEPWRPEPELPPGATETGAWAVGHIEDSSKYPGAGLKPVNVPISFMVQLGSALPAVNAHFINKSGKEVTGELAEVDSTACKGTAAAPSAEPGSLCVYGGVETSIAIFPFGPFGNGSFLDPATGNAGVSRAGTTMQVFIQADGAEGMGTWAVTAPEP